MKTVLSPGFAELSRLKHWVEAKAHSRGGDNVHSFEGCPRDGIMRTNRMATQITKKSSITANVWGVRFWKYEERAKYTEAHVGLVWVTEIQVVSMQSRKYAYGQERFPAPWQPSIGVKVIFPNDLQAGVLRIA